MIGGAGDSFPEWTAGHPEAVVLREVLDASRSRGLIGSTDNEDSISHSRGFGEMIPAGSRVLDLGSGGGLPGLVLAIGRPDLDLVLLDSAGRRTRFLESAVRRLEVQDRVSVLHGRAEETGRDERHRAQFDVVVSRSFGAPSVVAECARPFLADRGLLVVSEPPSGDGLVGSEAALDTPPVPTSVRRWPSAGLGELGFSKEGFERRRGYGFVVLRAVGECPQRFPRRPGMAAKRPLF